MDFHPEVMPAAQQGVLGELGSVAAENGFYLAGGPAIAIWLGHRESVDLDWFTRGEIADPLGLAERLRTRGLSFDVSGVVKGTLHGSSQAVKLSFLEYRYPLLQPVTTSSLLRSSAPLRETVFRPSAGSRGGGRG